MLQGHDDRQDDPALRTAVLDLPERPDAQGACVCMTGAAKGVVRLPLVAGCIRWS